MRISRYYLPILITAVMVLILPLTSWAASNPSVDPTAPPPGGYAASVLNTSPTTQKKLGSLIIGDPGIGQKNRLCLNATPGSNASTDPNCLASWGDIASGLGGPFVQLHQNNVGSSVVGNYTVQNGYVRIHGTQPTSPAFTVISDVNETFGGVTQTALYADGILQDNYAGYLAGHVSINPTLTGSLGRLCLNGTNDIDVNGYGCISSWTQVPGIATGFLQRQSVNPPIPQSGGVSLKKAFDLGAVVLGTPPSTSPASLSRPFCGDGLCSLEISENVVGNANYCPLDCVTPSLPLSLATASLTGAVNLSFHTSTDPSLNPGDLVYAVIIRSASTAPTFVPMDGQIYQPGGDGNFAIVYATYAAQNVPLTFTDNTSGIVAGRTYTYRFYQGNSYPIYRKVTANYVQATGVAIGSAADSGATDSGGGDTGSLIIPRQH